MSQLKTKSIENDAIDDSKARLRNNSPLRGRNAAGSADVSILKLNASDKAEALTILVVPDGAASGDAVNKGQLDAGLALKISSTEKGAASGVATLDGSGKVPAAQLPNSVMEYRGAYNASTNSPVVVDGTGNAGDVYRTSVAGSQNFGSGSLSLAVGDFIIYSGSIWEKSPASSFDFDAAFAAKSTSNLAEGSNLYFTSARAKAAAVADAIVDAVTDVAPSQNAVFDALALKANSSSIKIAKKEAFTLVAGDITNGYIDLAQVAATDSIYLGIKGYLPQFEVLDYTVSYTGGAGGKSRITFAGDLASAGSAPLASGDKVYVQYSY